MPTGIYQRKPFTQEHRENLRKALKGKSFPHMYKGHKFSEITKKKLRQLKLGKKNPNWKKGITPLKVLFRSSFKYRQWRLNVLIRDNFTFQECEQKETNLIAHHIKSFDQIIEEYDIKTLDESLECEELWDINNGITFCKNCHKKVHKKLIICNAQSL
ncbi:HNH endonuclease [Patescibacteria group bacterium AH-259-L07]|nr:HNH endonuclease [Patescibacteria group bacterium AH-259-L07]